MSQEKEVLDGIVTLGLTVKTADGELAEGTNVKMSADNEVEAVDANYDASIGYILVGNRETSGKCTVVTRGKRVAPVTSGAAYSVGNLLMWNSAGKAVRAKAVRASQTFTVVDYSAMATNTLSVNGVTLTNGTDFTAATSNAVTAGLIAAAINDKVPGVKATAAAAVVTVEALDVGAIGNEIAVADTFADNVGLWTGSAVFLAGGKDLFPFGMALEAATAADQSKSALWF